MLPARFEMEMTFATAASQASPEPDAAGRTGRDASVRGRLMACQDCDLLQTLGPDGQSASAACFRCGAVLVRGAGLPLHVARALGLAALPLFIAASTLPLISIDGRGGRVSASVWGAVAALLDQQRMPTLATLVLLTLIVLPAMQLLGTLILLQVVTNRAARGRAFFAPAAVLQVLETIRPWTQIEILLSGTIITWGRLSRVFHVVPGPGLVCLVAYLLLVATAVRFVDARGLWDQVSPEGRR